MDAAIVFSDILVILQAMGAEVQYTQTGPVVSPRPGGPAELARLRPAGVEDELGYVARAVEGLARELHPGTAVIGFAGAPFTLAAYLVEAGPSHSLDAIRALAAAEPRLYERLLTLLSDGVTEFLRLQIRAGADLVQIFDTWAGMLPPAEYRTLAVPFARRVVDGLADTGVPVVLYTRRSVELLEAAASTGCEVLSIDESLAVADARRRLGTAIPLQGNLDPDLLAGTAEAIRTEVRGVIDAVGGQGLIVNLSRGLTPASSPEGVGTLVQAVKEWKA
jgi:uroporphyrinogen decarboxylase